MTKIVTRMDGVWRVVDEICVNGVARNPKIRMLFWMVDVDSSVVNCVDADFVTHIIPRIWSKGERRLGLNGVCTFAKFAS